MVSVSSILHSKRLASVARIGIITLALLGILTRIGPTPTQAAAQAAQNADSLEFMPGELIVKLARQTTMNHVSQTTSSATLNAIISSTQVMKVIPVVDTSGFWRNIPANLANVYKFVVPRNADLFALAEQLMRDPSVEFAAPNFVGHIDSSTPNDTYYSLQWALKTNSTGANLNFPSAWDITTGSPDIVVAVLDTGFDIDHPDLDSKNTGTGYNFVGTNANVQDDHEHGTSVSGVIAAKTNNALGVSGAAWGVKIMPVKVCDSNGACDAISAYQGILYAASHHANVINMSFHVETNAEVKAMMQQAADYAHEMGTVLVAAAGNDRPYLDATDSDDHLPAELNHVIAVGATNQNDEDCHPSGDLNHALNCNWGGSGLFGLGQSGTGYGPALDVMAPGSTDIVTTTLVNKNNGYRNDFNGTSAAAPFVSGLAALVLSADNSLTPDQVETLIKENAHPLDLYGEGYPNQSFGWGRIDAYATLMPYLRTRLRPPNRMR